MTEEKLKQSQDNYRLLISNVPAVVYKRYPDGTIDFFDDKIEDLTGYPKEHFNGRRLKWSEVIVPEDLSLANHFGLLEHESDTPYVTEYRIRDINGKALWIQVREHVAFNQAGEIDHISGVFFDVTERRRAWEALQRSEARYRAIVEDQTELICRFLPDTTITFVNDAYCRYFGQQCDELIGRSFMPLIHEQDRAKLEALLASLSPAQPVGTVEHRVIIPTGEIRWQQWTNRLILDDQGQGIEFQAVGRDITERKLMEEALQKSAEEIKLFAYSVLHDLKNPALGVYGLAKRLHQQYLDSLDTRGQKYCHLILTAAEQIATLVEKINTYIATKEVPLTLEDVKLPELLQTVEKEYSAQLHSRQIRWSQPLSAPDLRADRLALLRAIRNLVDNALKYGGEKLSEITLGYTKSESHHIISVRDNGKGIRVENPDEIFRQFQRADTARGIAGSGLGLAIVKEIAEQHGGKVWVESAPGKGTTFYLSIAACC